MQAVIFRRFQGIHHKPFAMHRNYYRLSNQSPHTLHPEIGNFISASDKTGPSTFDKGFIRFEEKKDKYIWVLPDEIYFAKSADHYVKSLVKCGQQLKWMTRHNTLKELANILPQSDFIRLNRFYLLNLSYFSHISENGKLLYFKNYFSVAIPHRISPFLCHLLKSIRT